MANGYETPPSLPPHLLDLHPVEALLALLLISAAALHRLVTDPPRPMRRRKRFAVSYGALTIEESTACAAAARSAAAQVDQRLRQVRGVRLQASAAPAVGIAPGPTVAELRTMARKRGILSAGGRPIHKARRADLLASLGL